MTANLILIGATALIGLVGFLGLWLKSRQDMATGAQLEAGKVNEGTAATEAKVITAMANAPTQADDVAALGDKGDL